MGIDWTAQDHWVLPVSGPEHFNPGSAKVGLMHDPQTSREMKNCNGTLKTMKIKISAAQSYREKNFP